MTLPAPAARPAGAKDLDRLGELYLDLGRSLAAADATDVRAIDAGRAWREHLVRGLNDDRLRVPVTQGDRGHVVSFLVARVAAAPLGSAVPFVGLIDAAFVEEAFRRQGRLRAMYGDALRWFQVKRVPRIELVVSRADASSLLPWQRLGFEEARAVMRAPVPPE